ncbi:MAG: bifunctional oligoribonuclease/PAP phosphatase NrnA [Syntrophales bacterium]|nr:bifunctional oligoribonuclease/PAP phosphatase NrnA [Syntrophales bacterium]
MVQQIIEKIKQNNAFLITAHVRLDGDAVGSELALSEFLTNMGKKVVIYNQDPTPANYLFLPGTGAIVHSLSESESFDVAFVLDCSELERVGDDAAAKIGKTKTLINIDHHISNKGFCELRLIDPHASSTGELIFHLMKELGGALTKGIATNLYAAILTDTGGFRYGNTTRDALMISGQLVECGASPQWISQNVYENNALAKLRLLSKALSTLAFDEHGTVGSMVVHLRDFEETGALHEHTDGFVDLPRSVEGTKISILYSEISPDRFKVSMRSKDDVDIERVARAFGGGGHINAAACRVEGDIETVKRQILDEILAGQPL